MLSTALSVAAAKAKLTGLVVAAAAVGSAAAVASNTQFVPVAGDEAVVSEVSPSPSAEATAAPTASPTVAPEVSVTPAVTPTATLPPCTGDEKNHGAYVSSVAKDDSVKGRDHGKLVSEAARSDCGKKAAEGSDAPEVEESEAPEAAADSESEEDGAPKPEKTKKNTKHGQGRS